MNEWIKRNWIGVVLIIVLIVFLGFRFGGSKAIDVSDLTTSVNRSQEAPVQTFVPIVPATTVATPVSASADGEVEWCVQIDDLAGGHLPDLLKLGASNNRGGQNWFSNKVATGAERWGVLPDGTHFVKKELIDQGCAQLGVSPNKIDVISSGFGWSEKQMTLATVAGQPAYVAR